MRLLDWRKKTRTTQKGVAMYCGSAIRTVIRWEQGETLPSAEKQHKIEILTGGKVKLKDWLNGRGKS